MASVIYGKCYLWQMYYGKCNYGKNIYGKNIMANETEPLKRGSNSLNSSSGLSEWDFNITLKI